MTYQEARDSLIRTLAGRELSPVPWSRVPRIVGAMGRHDPGRLDHVLCAAYHYGSRIPGAPQDRDKRQRDLVRMVNAGCSCGKCKGE